MLHPFSIHNNRCQLVVRGGSRARLVALRNIGYIDKAVLSILLSRDAGPI